MSRIPNFNRPPDRFGNFEANAELRYVEVYSIDSDPGEMDDFPIPYQPVQVKKLRFDGGYLPATSGVVTTDNTDVTIRTVKSHKKHGTRGNGIGITGEIDSGITDNAEASWDEASDTLAIKAKAATVTWKEISAAVAVILKGAFALVADLPEAEVGSGFDTFTATLSGGVDGDWEMYETAFGIGDHDLKDNVTTGDRLWIIWRNDAQRWEVIAGESGLHNITKFAKVITQADKNGGSIGECILLDEDMAPVDADGDPLILDAGDPDYDSGLVAAAAVEFKCVQVYAACPVDARIELSSIHPITPGQNWGDNRKVWGKCVDVVDYTWDLDGAAEKTSLVIPEGATGPGDIKWLGGEC